MKVNSKASKDFGALRDSREKSTDTQKASAGRENTDLISFERKPSIWERDPSGTTRLGKFTRVLSGPPPRPEFYARAREKQEALDKSNKNLVPAFEEALPPSVQKEVLDELRSRYGFEFLEFQQKAAGNEKSRDAASIEKKVDE